MATYGAQWGGSGDNSPTTPQQGGAGYGAQWGGSPQGVGAVTQGGGGWGWNPLADLTKGVSSIGSWVDAHTQIGSFNPGIGSMAATAANMLPGLINVGVHVGGNVISGNEWKAGQELADVGKQLFHGFEDFSADVTTAGGLAPWTKSVEQGMGSVYGYTPSSLKQYATNPGQGLGGALFNDAANLAMVADGAGALAKAGELGKIADSVRTAETAGKVGAADAGATLEDIGKGGEVGRFQRLHEAVDQAVEAAGEGKVNPEALRTQILNRMATLDKIDTVRNVAGNIIQPWRSLRPLERAATALRTQESPEGAQVAPTAAEVAAGSPVPGEPLKAAEGPTGASQAKVDFHPVDADTFVKFMDEAGNRDVGGVKASEMLTSRTPEEWKAGGYRMFLSADGKTGYALDPNGDLQGVINNNGAKGAGGAAVEHAISQGAKTLDAFQLPSEGMPEGLPGFYAKHGFREVTREHWNDQVAGKTGMSNGARPDVVYMDLDPNRVVVKEPTAGSIPAPPDSATAETTSSAATQWFHNLRSENVPRAYQSYIELSTPPPRWAMNVVAKLPEAVKTALTWMDAHHLKIDYQRITREQQRSVAISAKEIENRPEIQALRAAATDLVKKRLPGVTPAVASNIVGQVINAYVTHGVDLIEQLEGNRQALEEALPGQGSLLTDALLHYTIDMPPEINTPEFRAELYKLAEPYKQMRLAASKDMWALSNKGMPPDQNIPILTRAEMRLFNQANHKLAKAADLEAGAIPKQLAGLAKEKAWANDERGRAIAAAQLAVENMVDAKTDFDRSRYTPPAVNTPEKMARAAKEMVNRLVAKSSATFNPHTGQFIEVAGDKKGFLVGALHDSALSIRVADFLRVQDNGRTVGEDMISHFVPAYQEAYQFPDMMVQTWLDDNGQVHIDPVQFMEGDTLRDRAIVTGNARGQGSIKDVGRNEEIPIPNDPNVSAYFMESEMKAEKNHTKSARTTIGEHIRSTNDQILDAGGTGMTPEDMDRAMVSFDRLAVVQHLMHPETYKTADDVYKTFDVTFAQKASPVEGALNEVRLMLQTPSQIKRILHPLMQVAGAESRWYFKNHDYIEKIGAQLGDVHVGFSSFGNHRDVSGADLLYSLIAIESIKSKPSEDIAGSLAAFKNISSFQVQKWAKAIREWEAMPQRERTSRSGSLETLPPVLQELLRGSNQAARRQTLAVLDGHTVDTWDADFVRNTLPKYGDVKGAKLPVGSVTAEERAALPEEAAIMEHFGSAAQAKLRSFYENLRDPENSMSVTLDSHMARAFGHGDSFWSGPNWFKHAQMIRGIASDLSAEYGRKVMPHEVQAALWYWVKTEYASVNHAATRANVLDNLKAIENGTYSEGTDAVHQFNQMLEAEARTPRPHGDMLVEPRKMRFLNEPVAAPAAEGMTRLYRGTDQPEMPGRQEGFWWSIKAPKGRQGYANWQYTDVPTASAQRLLKSVKADAARDAAEGGKGGSPVVGKDVILDPNNPAMQRWMEQAKPSQEAVERTVPWRREAVGINSKEYVRIAAIGDAYKAEVVDKIAALDLKTPEGRAAATKIQMDWLGKKERALQNTIKGENFWDAEKKPTFQADANALGVGLPGDLTTLNEFRDDLVGQFVPTSRTQGGVIKLFKGADIATLLHEQGHLLRALTTGEDLKSLERAYGVVGHKWTPEAEEAFVHDFLASASQDVRFAGNPEMLRLKDNLAQVYGDFGENLHPEIDSFWQKVLAPNIAKVNAPGFDLSTGERIIGKEGKSELGKTMGQRQQQTPNISAAETPQQTYTRGAKGQAAIEDWRNAQRRQRIGQQAAARANAHVDRLEKMINERTVPAAAAAAAFTRSAADDLDKLYKRIDDPAVSRVPPKWQPMVESARAMAKMVEQHPELEPILEQFPKTFGEAMDYAEAHGFDPAYMPALTPAKVRSLIAGTASLGGEGTNEMGKRFTSGARKQRSGALQRIGGQDTSIEALVAGLNQSVQEARTNMIVDWLDRSVAKDLPVNEAGRRLGAPPGWVEWDPIRRGMLGADTATGERVAVGATKMIPKPVSDAIREYAGQPPTNPIYRGLKMITDPWRTLMLTLNPGFYLKHFQGHVMLAAIAGGLDLKAWVDAWHAARSGGAGIGSMLFKGEGFKDLPQVTGQNIIFNEMGQPGVVGYDTLRDAMASGGVNAYRHALADRAHNVISATDSFARAVAYFAKRHKGYSDMQAAQYAMDAVIDYGNLSNVERYWVRSLVPFYSFEKGVAKIVFRLPMDHPLAASLLMSLAKVQQEQAVDSNGNPLPERYQGVVDLPLLGPTDMQKFSPFKDVAALATPDGLIQSLQFAVQDVVRAGTGLAAPGTKATVKVDKYGRLVPDVSLPSQIAASFSGGPQGQVIQGGPISHFLGLPTVSQATLDKAGARNVLAQSELAAADRATQEKSAFASVDTQMLQQNLRKQLDTGVSPTLPQAQGANQPTFTQDQMKAAVDNAVAAQQARAAATRAAHPRTSKGGSTGRVRKARIRKGFTRRSSSVFKIRAVKVGGRSF